MLTVTTIGLTCKAVFKLGLCSITVNGLPNLVSVVEDDARRKRRIGLITVSNHISTYTSPVLSYFFRNGQVLETFRGNGVYQRSIDTAIEKLNDGAWVHLFGEGKVNQPDKYPQKDGLGHLPRFKWGAGRILSEVGNLPTIIPMWLTGFDRLMPEGRKFPFNFMPRFGQHLSVTFGEPISGGELQKIVNYRHASRSQPSAADLKAFRSALVTVLHESVESLGRSVSGDSLTGEK
ncbi:tafazzin-PC [Fistulina hepatica ATCC 64428]|uniref:Tafazzin family protein n=1 Tax=Fistulina hepatica ATCC 64428 TaxID=1128425 RepID=A0A0D7A7R5_9AGAR|nr:tafazzin-PC [Fistulina hepatica ATCC 64428]